jgi:hypothetical protein
MISNRRNHHWRQSMKVQTTVLIAVWCVASACETRPSPDPSSFSSAMYQLQLGDSSITAHGAAVTAEFFEATGERPLLGRLFSNADFDNAERVAIISDALWKDRFNAGAEIIGRSVVIDGEQTVVVGIMPPGFRTPENAQLWIPRKLRQQ